MAVAYGRVTLKVAEETTDSTDLGKEPDLVPMTGYVLFTRPTAARFYADTANLITVLIQDRAVQLDASGVMRELDSEEGVRLAAGPWIAQFRFTGHTYAPRSFILTSGQVLDLLDT